MNKEENDICISI